MIKHFTIYDANGAILRAGSCPEEDFALQARSREMIVEAKADPRKDAVNPATGQVVVGGRPPVPVQTPSYAEVRRNMYPSVEDQLDMIWHAMDQNVLPRVEPLYSMILSVKQAVPKNDNFEFEVGRI